MVTAGVAPGAAQLRDFLRTQLPDYMIPAAVVVLDEFPLTPNGKIDRAALPAPEAARWAPAPQAPRGELENTIAEVWAEVLGRPPGTISAREDFFDAGGHSLLATKVVARLERRLGRPVAAAAVRRAHRGRPARSLGHPGPGDGRAADEDVPPLAAGPRDGRVLASFSQQRLWFLHQMDPGSALYNLPLAVRLTGGSTSRPCTRRCGWPGTGTRPCAPSSPPTTTAPSTRRC